MPLTYDPRVFAVRDIAQAMEIILTNEDVTTRERWAKETPYLSDMIEEQLGVSPATLLLDYGTGIGRMAKELIARQDCTVVGVDISPHMRALGGAYVASPRYASCDPEMLDTLLAGGLRFDAAIAIWVLQHCASPQQDIALIAAAVKPGGALFLVNNHGRAVPTAEEGWIDDGVDIRTLLLESFTLEAEGALEAQHTSPAVAKFAFWARLRRLAEDAG